jgi:hypothetical protein
VDYIQISNNNSDDYPNNANFILIFLHMCHGQNQNPYSIPLIPIPKVLGIKSNKKSIAHH